MYELVSFLWKLINYIFRGGGFISLENLIFFAKTYPVGIFFDMAFCWLFIFEFFPSLTCFL